MSNRIVTVAASPGGAPAAAPRVRSCTTSPVSAELHLSASCRRDRRRRGPPTLAPADCDFATRIAERVDALRHSLASLCGSRLTRRTHAALAQLECLADVGVRRGATDGACDGSATSNGTLGRTRDSIAVGSGATTSANAGARSTEVKRCAPETFCEARPPCDKRTVVGPTVSASILVGDRVRFGMLAIRPRPSSTTHRRLTTSVGGMGAGVGERAGAGAGARDRVGERAGAGLMDAFRGSISMAYRRHGEMANGGGWQSVRNAVVLRQISESGQYA